MSDTVSILPMIPVEFDCTNECTFAWAPSSETGSDADGYWLYAHGEDFEWMGFSTEPTVTVPCPAYRATTFQLDVIAYQTRVERLDLRTSDRSDLVTCLPEPGGASGLALAIFALVALGRRRSTRGRGRIASVELGQETPGAHA